MTPKEKTEQLLHEYRMLFMKEGEDYGQEILVFMLSRKCALIAVNEILENFIDAKLYDKTHYWFDVKKELEVTLW